MPPAQKFLREQFIGAALSIVRREGYRALTARSMATELGTSTRPVFTEFTNMEEVKNETRLAAKAIYNEHVAKFLTWTDPFRGMGMGHYLFAKEEPRLYEFLFMTRDMPRNVLDTIFSVSNYYEIGLESIQKLRGISSEDAKTLIQVMVTHVHGISCLLVTGAAQFTDEEVINQITAVCISVRISLQKGVYGIDTEAVNDKSV